MGLLYGQCLNAHINLGGLDYWAVSIVLFPFIAFVSCCVS